MKPKILIILILFTAITCKNNRLKSDEKSLAKQILSEEQQLAQEAELRAEREKQLADSLAKLPKGFRFVEDRSIDPQGPPVIIDIIRSRFQNPQPVKLSQLFKKIEYIKLEQPQDTNEFRMGISFVVAPDFIYINTTKRSIHQYDKSGHFIKTICTGNRQYQKISEEQFFNSPGQPNLFEGADNAYWNGSKLCYSYKNQPAQKSYLLIFDNKTDNDLQRLQLPDPEGKTSGQINGIGTIISETRIISNQYSKPTPYLLGGKMLALPQKQKRVEFVENFINMVSVSGDTICTFPDHDPIRNFAKSTYRGVDEGDVYYSNGSLFVRQSFNDTIYQLFPPNRLVPKYILDFGDLGIRSAQEGIDPGVNLEENLVPQAFLETDRYLFITYSKDYDCPNTAKSGTLKYSRLVFDKKKNSLLVLYIDQAPYVQPGKMAWPSAPDINVENDIDEMPFKWPASATANRQPFSVLSGKDLLKIKSQNLPVKNIQENDRIIAIYC